MPVSKIPSAGIDSGGVAPSNLSTGAPSWDSSGNLSFNSGYGSSAVAYGVRAWCNFNGTGTPSIRAGGNVSSITDRAVGEYDVNFTNAMPDANYSFQGNRMYRGVVNAEGNTTTYARIYVAETDAPYPFDPQFCYIAIIR